MNRKSGISLLDVIILILVIGVIAALVIPNTRLRKAEKAEIACREQQLAISEAMMRFFTTTGDTSLLHLDEEPSEGDTLGEVEEIEDEEEAEPRPHLFTDDTTLLRPYLPEKYSFKCPLDDDPYIIIVRDSIFYSISCQNGGHGQVIKGQATWEE